MFKDITLSTLILHYTILCIFKVTLRCSRHFNLVGSKIGAHTNSPHYQVIYDGPQHNSTLRVFIAEMLGRRAQSWLADMPGSRAQLCSNHFSDLCPRQEFDKWAFEMFPYTFWFMQCMNTIHDILWIQYSSTFFGFQTSRNICISKARKPSKR